MILRLIQPSVLAMRTIRFFSLGLFFLALLPANAEKPRLNVLFLITDDQSFDTIAALGNSHIQTPNMDRLLKGGVAFKNAYIMGGTSPAVCSPSRASLFGGKSLWNTECQGQFGFELSEKNVTLPEVFRKDGYETYATGKNEPGIKGHFARSFSAAEHILFKGMTRDQYQLPLYEFDPKGDYPNQKPVMHKGTHSDIVYSDACIRFLEKQDQATKPFFAYVAFQTPHDPRQAPADFRERYKDEEMPLPPAFMPEHPFDNGMLRIRDENLAPFPRTEPIVRKHLADYYAAITHVDFQIGRILTTLDQKGLRENTLIVLTSDNGLAIGSHGLMGKQNIYDHSVHVPLILSGPGIPKGETRDQLCYIYDLYPTLCDFAAIKTPETVEFKSLVPVLKDAQAKHRDQLYFAFMSWQRSIYDGQYKLIEYCVNGARTTQLFDLRKDPHELKNLSNHIDHAKDLGRLRKLLEAERTLLNDGNSPYPFTDKQGKDFWQTYDSLDVDLK
jgi:arylsulfatase A-like enzyme